MEDIGTTTYLTSTSFHERIDRRGGGVVERATPEPKVVGSVLTAETVLPHFLRGMMATLPMENSTVAN